MEVLSTRGFLDNSGAQSNNELSNGFNNQMRQLLAQRERLLAEIYGQERHEAAELTQGKALIAAAEAAEKEHREAAVEANSRRKRAEEKLTLAENVQGSRSDLWKANEGLGTSRAILQEEASLHREKLASSRNFRAGQVVARAASERQRLDECINAIRTKSQENQAVEASQQMSQAHLKALEAMAASSEAQVRARESALENMLQQLESQEILSAEVHVRQEVIEAQLEAAVEDIQHYEAICGPSSMARVHLKQYDELSQECKALKNEVDLLKQESVAAQDKLDRGRKVDSNFDDQLQTSVEELRRACASAARASHNVSLKKPLLESEVARLTTELLSEKCVVADLEEIRSSIFADSQTFHTGVDARVAALNTHLATEKVDAAAVASLEHEEHSLQTELAEREADCQRLRAEAGERNKQFVTIKQTLLEQIAVLRTEEMEADQAVPRMCKERPRPGNHWLPSPGLLNLPSGASDRSFRAVAHGISAPPTRLKDPGCGAEPPPRRELRRENSNGSALQRTSLTNSHSQPLLASRQQHRPPSPFEQQCSADNTRIISAHRPHWREMDRAWHPNTSVPQRAAHVRPSEELEFDAFGGARSVGVSRNAGSFDSSGLFHTHNASASFDSNLFNTPPVMQAQRASPTATTLRRSATTREHIFIDALDHRAALMTETDSWLRGNTALRRARTPPARPPSAASRAMSKHDPLTRGIHSSSDDLHVSQISSLTQQEPHRVPDERRTALQLRLAELKGVIGASLQSLDEEEAADANAWAGARTTALGARNHPL